MFDSGMTKKIQGQYIGNIGLVKLVIWGKSKTSVKYISAGLKPWKWQEEIMFQNLTCVMTWWNGRSRWFLKILQDYLVTRIPIQIMLLCCKNLCGGFSCRETCPNYVMPPMRWKEKSQWPLATTTIGPSFPLNFPQLFCNTASCTSWCRRLGFGCVDTFSCSTCCDGQRCHFR